MIDLPPITLDEAIARYDGLLFDAYGVLVHGVGPLPGAVAAIDRLNRAGTTYFVVTNDASKLPETAARRYARFGLKIPAERIITSGVLLDAYFAEHGLAGARCAVMGPPDSEEYVRRAGGHVVPTGEPFDVLVVGDESGFPFLETADVLLGTLYRLLDAGRRVHLVLPNPDLIYPTLDGFGFAAGSIAAMFEGALRLRYPERDDLVFARLGKPHAAIFAEAARRAGSRRLLMFGDQFETDIRGARAYGFDVVWLLTGVTTVIPESTPAELRPTYRLQSLDRA